MPEFDQNQAPEHAAALSSPEGRTESDHGSNEGSIPAGVHIEHGDLVIDTDKYQVLVRDKEIHLTLTEFQLLLALASAPGRVFSREQLLGGIQRHHAIDKRNIDVHILQIRKKFGRLGNMIVTVRSLGYKLRD